MTPELWRRLKPLYECALDIPAEQRAGYVAEACAGDPQLEKELQNLLADHDAETATLDEPIFDLHALKFSREQSFADGTVLLGRFRIVRLLGSGGMGEVYEAIDTHLGRIALKTVIGDITGSPERLLRFRKEVQLARSVSNPHVCRIYELFLTEGSEGAFVTMEFLNGVTLADKIRESGPLPWREARTVTLELCEALHSIHEAEIIHRDLKTRNVMLAARGGAISTVVMDFGIARRLSHQSRDSSTGITNDGAIVGTPDYMAPEQFEGKEATPATDIYALGVVLYEIATGKRPVRDDANNARNERPKHLTRPSSFQPRIPRRFDEVVCKCLEYDPNRRYQSAREVERAIRLPAIILSIQEKPFTAAAGLIGFITLLSSLLLIPAIGERARGLLFSSNQKHIAVLPFDEAGTSPETEALGDGLMDSLSGKLANLDASNQSLWVVPSSEVRLRKVRSPSTALREFGATIVIEGRFERNNATNHLKLTLIDSKKTREIGYVDIQSEGSDLALLQVEAITRLGRLMNISTAGNQERGDDEPTNPAAYEDYLTGLGYYERYDLPGNIDSAISTLKRSIAKDASFSPAYAALAQAYTMQFQETSNIDLLDEAERLARKAAEVDDQTSSTYTALGQIHELTGKYDLAIHEFQRAISLDPRSPDPVKGIASSYEDAGRYVEAEAAYLKSVALRPDDWKGYNELGNFYEDTGRPRDAILQYNKALKLTPDNSWVYTNLGIAYMDFDDTRSLQQAEALFKKSIAIDPTDIAFEDLGYLYMMKRQFSDSVKASRAAIQLNDKRYSTWYDLALAYEWLNDRREADVARVRAIDLVEAALRRDPQNHSAVATSAPLYAKAGSKKRAWEQIHTAIAEGSFDRYTCSQIADAYVLLGERRSAAIYLQKAFALGLNKTQLSVYPELMDIIDPSQHKPF